MNEEIAKIEKEADHLEDHAVDAIVTAAFALREAEVAIVEAAMLYQGSDLPLTK